VQLRAPCASARTYSSALRIGDGRSSDQSPRNINVVT
jgi:hypothetical protein